MRKSTFLAPFLFFCIFILFPFGGKSSFCNCLGAKDSTAKKTVKANILKIAPMELMNGDFPIYLEHRFTNHLTGEVGLGITFKDLFWELARSFSEFNSGHETEAKAGFSVKAAAKVYFSDVRKAPAGGYFSAKVSYRFNQVLCAVCMDRLTFETGPFLNEHRNSFDGIVTMGYQIYFKGNFVVDPFIGGGVRYTTGMIARCVEVEGSGPISVLKYEQDIVPRFSIGVRFGFGFSAKPD